MPHYCPLRAALPAQSRSASAGVSPGARSRRVRAAVVAACLRIVGWHRIERVFAAIPRSNDDFGIG
jgi:hypothetical protein